MRTVTEIVTKMHEPGGLFDFTKEVTWVWLLGDEPIDAGHAQYGCPVLAAVCERYGFPIPQDKETQNMINGDPCSPDCREGCGA